MIAIIKWTLWQRRWSTLWWSVSVFALIFITLIFYPSFRDSAHELEQSFSNLPDAAVQLFGGSTDFFSPIGFLNSQIFFFTLPMVLGILAIGLGNSMIGKEVQDLTIESLLSRPVSRFKLLGAKAAAGLIILSIVTLVSLLTTLATAQIVNLELSAGLMALTVAACYLLVLSFAAIAFFLSCLGKTKGASIGITAFIALGGYIISSLAGTVDWLKIPAKLFPFHYYQSEAILRQTFDWNNLLFFGGVIIVCAGLSWWSFKKRDIY